MFERSAIEPFIGRTKSSVWSINWIRYEENILFASILWAENGVYRNERKGKLKNNEKRSTSHLSCFVVVVVDLLYVVEIAIRLESPNESLCYRGRFISTHTHVAVPRALEQTEFFIPKMKHTRRDNCAIIEIIIYFHSFFVSFCFCVYDVRAQHT